MEWMDSAPEWVTTYGINAVGAIAILVLGWIVAGIVRGGARRALRKSRMDEGLVGFLGSLAYAAVIAAVVIAALGRFGIETASFVAVLGALAFAVGFALQGSLSNFASGVMILLFRPFTVGQWIEAAGISGSVQQIGIFSTIVHTGDNVQIIVPNSKVYGDIIKNYSANETRRVDFVFGIGYGSSIEDAVKAIQALVQADERSLSDPAPMFVVGELADSSVNLIVRVWVKAPDYWGFKFDLTRKVKEDFDAKGIEIPFPQQVVHHMNQG